MRRSLPEKVQLCCGAGKLTPEQARYIRNIAFTSVEQYVTRHLARVHAHAPAFDFVQR
jgi:hypothetical protein